MSDLVEKAPCSCIKGIEGARPPILDPFCNNDRAHAEIAVLHYEPVYESKGAYDPTFIAVEEDCDCE